MADQRTYHSAAADHEDYASVRAAIAEARRRVEGMQPGNHYATGCGFYELVGGRTVEVGMVPAVGGGVLLGSSRRYRVNDARGRFGKWRSL